MKQLFVERASLIRGDIGRDAHILEIGPSSKPLSPKADGWNALVVDYAPTETILDRFRHDIDSLSRIEKVDFIWNSGPLADAVPHELHGSFDGIICSHVIEHLPDLLGFFKSAEILLSASGSMGFAIPDKRHCFDFFKPITMTGDVISAHNSPEAVHSGRTAFNDTAYSITNKGRTGWGKIDLNDMNFVFDIGRAIAVMRRAESNVSGVYYDLHRWYFTPSSFELIILELAQMGFIDWTVTFCAATYVGEFIVNMKRGRRAYVTNKEFNAARMNLLKQTFREVKEQAGMISNFDR